MKTMVSEKWKLEDLNMVLKNLNKLVLSGAKLRKSFSEQDYA